MIKQTIYVHRNPAIHKITCRSSYEFDGGIATVELDSVSKKYVLLANGSKCTIQDYNAGMDSDYEPAIYDVSKRMKEALDERDAAFTAMHKKAAPVLTISEYQKKIDGLSPDRYNREAFPLPRPNRDEIRRELEREAGIRFADLFEDTHMERALFVDEHEEEALDARLQAYEEVSDFFDKVQDYKEAAANAAFQQEYERKKKDIEDFIYGEISKTENNIQTILSSLTLPFSIDVTCDYNKQFGLLSTIIEMPIGYEVPTTRAIMQANGRVIIKDKHPMELEQTKTDTILSFVYYVAASLFNATINIQRQRITVLTSDGAKGILWVEFDREHFSQLDLQNLSPQLDYPFRPHIDSSRSIRGFSQIEPMDIATFNGAINERINQKEITSMM